MSCGNGCGCCPKCGCRATCTCNQNCQSNWFDDNMSDFRYSVIVMASVENGKCGASCGCSTGNYTKEGFSCAFFSEAAENAALWG